MISLDGFATFIYAAFLSVNPSLSIEINELECMMEAVVYEAIGEPLEGKKAVANVITQQS